MAAHTRSSMRSWSPAHTRSSMHSIPVTTHCAFKIIVTSVVQKKTDYMSWTIAGLPMHYFNISIRHDSSVR
jgi:hypothetical protein